MRRTLFGFISLSMMWTVSANALSVKHDSKAARGCVPQVSMEQAKGELQRFNLRTLNAKPEEIRALGTGLYWIEKLAGNKPLDFAKGKSTPAFPFRFVDSNSYSHQAPDEIFIARKGRQQLGKNVAQLVHELGHYVGNNGAYSQYRAATGGQFCIVSGYSGSRFNEQFAENFAAYVTNPGLIKRSRSAACQKSYKFFSKLFVRSDLAEKCASGRLKAEDYN